MGCTGSKIDDLPAVVLCRDRCSFLREAIQQRYALAESHVAYIHSLKVIGELLCDFIQYDHGDSGRAPLSPMLNLPPQRKGDHAVLNDDRVAAKNCHAVLHSHSNSGSHLHFHSDSSDDEDDTHSHLHDSVSSSSPLHNSSSGDRDLDVDYQNVGQESFSAGRFVHMNYMKNKAAEPTIVYEQRPEMFQAVHFGEPSTSSYDYYGSSAYPGSSSTSYQYFSYPNEARYGHASAMNVYNGSPIYRSASPQRRATFSPKPPPSPPRASGWEFLNFFDSYDHIYPTYSPDRNSKEVREDEGIPELEDENHQEEVVKKVHVDEKHVDAHTHHHAKPKITDDGPKQVGHSTESSPSQPIPRTTVSNEDHREEYEVQVVEKKVVDDNRARKQVNAGSKGHGNRGRDASHVASEIKIQFERASEAGNEVAKLLEAGNLPYHPKNVSKFLNIVSLLPSASKSIEALFIVDKSNQARLEMDEDMAMRCRDLSSTLQKLHLWEKKLFHEVKAEEKLRVAHEKKCHRLKRLDERGAEAKKVDATRILMRNLSTKIRIAFQVVDNISGMVSKIRDEELWPLLIGLINGLSRMWRGMLDCHHCQHEAISGAIDVGHMRLKKNECEARLSVTMQLELELLSWTSSFSDWIRTQKGYVRALNNWLLKCLLYEPEETPDGIVPFSPSRIGAPPVFVICNQWARAMDGVSEKQVIDAMRVFAMNVFHLFEQDKLEMHARMTETQDSEKKDKSLDVQEQKIQKQIHALDKKIVLVSGNGEGHSSLTSNVIYQSDTSNSSLRGSLQRLFEAMENLASNMMKAYDELLKRIEEEMHP